MNLYENLNFSKTEEVTTVFFEDEKMRIERIHSSGQTSGLYDQEEDEWVTLLEGESTLDVEGKQIHLKKGDQLYLPAHKKHKIKYTSEKCIWLCVFLKNS